MSHAVVATAFGGPEVLAVVETSPPAPGPGEVSIRVRAAAINPIDHKLYSGMMGDDPSQLPMPLGLEVAGEVSAVGADAEGPAGTITVGDHVIAYPVTGGYADHVTVPATSVLPKPETLSWEEASGLLLVGVTAVHALAAVSASRGDTLLVHGVAGGVGLMTAQIALDDGATVIGTAAGARHDDLRRFGIVPVAYGEGLADRVSALAPGGVHAAIDTVGTDEAVDVSLELVGDAARVVSIAAFGRAGTGLQLIGGGPGADPGTELRDAARLPLVRRAAEGTLRVVVARTFGLADAADAHRYVMQGHAGGKVVLTP